MKKLYCFDFDGTLTTRDTMFLFLKHYNRRKFYFEFARHSPLFVLLKLGFANAERVKKSFISSVLRGESEKKLLKTADLFFEENFPVIMRENALGFIHNLDRENTGSVIVTASLDLWVRPFARHFGMDLLATEALFDNGIFTGKFRTANCNGPEKVVRLRAYMSGRKFDKVIAFGDTPSDKPMMEWADESHYRFFH